MLYLLDITHIIGHGNQPVRSTATCKHQLHIFGFLRYEFEQFIFLRINDRRVHALTALFALGAALFGWAWLAAQGQP